MAKHGRTEQDLGEARANKDARDIDKRLGAKVNEYEICGREYNKCAGSDR
jgi:hypothetical protein